MPDLNPWQRIRIFSAIRKENATQCKCNKIVKTGVFTLAEEVKQEVQKTEKKKSILSGIQPTGIFTLGNYIGAVLPYLLFKKIDIL